MIAPAAMFTIAFLAWPAVRALGGAFETPAGAWTLDNFRALVDDTDFALATRNTLLLLAIVIPLEFVVALSLAVLAQSRLRGRRLLVSAWSFPLATSDLTAGLVWLAIFTQHGYLNSALQQLGWIRQPIGFLDYDNLLGLIVAVVLAESWRSISLVMVIFVSGLQSLPADVGEAAATLGADAWRRFRHVTLPLLRPTIQVALILRTTAALQLFAVVLALTGNGVPVLATRTVSHMEAREYQTAAAYAALLLVLSSLSTILYLAALRTPRHVFQP